MERKQSARALRTKQKLLDAVGHILETEGFTELKVTKIESTSGVDKKLIYFHFGDFDNLIKEYLRSKDFWLNHSAAPEKFDKEEVKGILHDQFNQIYESDLLKQMIIWELAGNNEVLKGIVMEREALGNQLIDAVNSANSFKEDATPLFALLVAGIYYLNTHARAVGTTFCGLNIKEEEDRKRVVDCISRLVDKLE
ncbi:TetR/AcrR family transcriptional regulator [Sphingobacterium deserti]|uniref:TetR family transcriptional regulator n=1 Tax=Sphingobacterium deserti TaxID=1229276 RepID=A0A0B8T1J6_9SPHI|nr:TetR/AcrR family transcriptional regulator [Sphingobacterium deserti]KGE12548.1 TetR family transcriptional regulator [Sphingobacterium deserti]